jgi:hypothetical protein
MQRALYSDKPTPKGKMDKGIESEKEKKSLDEDDKPAKGFEDFFKKATKKLDEEIAATKAKMGHEAKADRDPDDEDDEPKKKQQKKKGI